MERHYGYVVISPNLILQSFFFFTHIQGVQQTKPKGEPSLMLRIPLIRWMIRTTAVYHNDTGKTNHYW